VSPFTLDYLARMEAFGLVGLTLQGALVALSWLGWERATRGASANLRHRLICAHFLALAILPALTLAVLQWTVSGMVVTRAGPAEALRPWLGAARPLVALALPAAGTWLAGVMLVGARLAVEGRRLRRLTLSPASPALAQRVAALAAGVHVCEADVASPLVMGVRRPVLVLPHSLDTRLTPDELNAVLLHELAHIERGDFGWNLAQSLLLAVLWFNPAAWMLHARLRREREVRCDALAVRRGAAPTALARALVRLAETCAAPPLAMALTGRTDLRVRLERLLTPGGDRPASVRRLTVALAATGLCLLALGAGRLALCDPSIRDSYVASAFGPTISIEAADRAGPFAVQIRQGRVVAATLGREPLPPARILQRGGRVILIGGPRQPVVALTVSPRGFIFWNARS
jgi:beta-lactamase regulating signal transducer with metallopeptidase domain